MPEPFALLPFAMAAAGGRIDGVPAAQLVAAGLTLLQRCAPLVRALDGRRAAMLLPTSPAFLVAMAASEGRGAVLVNPLAAPLEIAYQLADADVGAVFTLSALADRVPDRMPHVLLDDAPRSALYRHGGEQRTIDLGQHHPFSVEGAGAVDGADDEAAIVYTSALYGTPAGAILTHRNLLENARATVTAAAFDSEDVSLAILPFTHLFGLVVSGAAPLLAGARVVTMDRFNPARAMALLEEGQITAVSAVPAVYLALLAILERRGAALRSPRLRLCICGGAPLDSRVQDRWHELTGVELRQGYGLTEAGPVCLFNRVGSTNIRGSLGSPFPGVDVTIRRPLTYDAPGGGDTPNPRCAAGAEGEICVRGANVFRGYVGGAPGLERRGGWLHTGDRGVMDAQGIVRFTGLVKPMFTRNGFNIYPREIAAAMRELPGVRDVRVRAIPHPLRENDVALDLVGSVTVDAVRAWAERRLSAYKQPSEILIHDRISAAVSHLDDG